MGNKEKISKILSKANNLLIKINVESKKTGQMKGIPIEIYMNDCLGYIEGINTLSNISNKQREMARRRLFDIYFQLQSFRGSERQTRKPDKEIPFSSLSIDIDSIADVGLLAADAYQGGLGYSVAKGQFLTDTTPKTNPYWKPPKKKSPVLDVSRETYDTILSQYLEEKEKYHRMTLNEFHEEMDRQKQEVLYEVRKLREASDTDQKRVFIL